MISQTALFSNLSPLQSKDFILEEDFIRHRRIYSVKDGFNCEALLRKASQGFSEALEVDYLALAEELYGVVDVGVVGEAQDVVVGDAGLLLCGEVLL